MSLRKTSKLSLPLFDRNTKLQSIDFFFQGENPRFNPLEFYYSTIKIIEVAYLVDASWGKYLEVCFCALRMDS